MKFTVSDLESELVAQIGIATMIRFKVLYDPDYFGSIYQLLPSQGKGSASTATRVRVDFACIANSSSGVSLGIGFSLRFFTLIYYCGTSFYFRTLRREF